MRKLVYKLYSSQSNYWDNKIPANKIILLAETKSRYIYELHFYIRLDGNWINHRTEKYIVKKP